MGTSIDTGAPWCGTLIAPRRKTRRNLAALRVGGLGRRRELIARMLDRASRLLDDAEGEADRTHARAMQRAAGDLIAFAQEIAVASPAAAPRERAG